MMMWSCDGFLFRLICSPQCYDETGIKPWFSLNMPSLIAQNVPRNDVTADISSPRLQEDEELPVKLETKHREWKLIWSSSSSAAHWGCLSRWGFGFFWALNHHASHREQEVHRLWPIQLTWSLVLRVWRRWRSESSHASRSLLMCCNISHPQTGATENIRGSISACWEVFVPVNDTANGIIH